MKEKSGQLSATEFFEKLQQNKLTRPLENNLRGMVKKSENKAKTIEFSLETHCENWFTLPLELIKTVVVLQTVPCKDHFHAYVEITLAEPKTSEGKLLMSLLTSIYRNCKTPVNYAKGIRCERGEVCWCSDLGGYDCNPDKKPTSEYPIPVVRA